jgi:microcystin-dependent protein
MVIKPVKSGDCTMKRLLASAAFASALTLTCPGLASAQEPFLGEVRLFGFNFCPLGWLAANGQLLPLNQFTALFSLLGTTYGGNGTTNFSLPDLRGRAPVAPTPQQVLGGVYGAPSVTLTMAQLPAHTHALRGTSQPPATNNPSGSLLATFPVTEKNFAAGTSPSDTPLSQASIGSTGSGQPVPTQSPILAMNWCVATQGIFPSRP